MALVEDVIRLLETQDGLTAKDICSALNLEPKREKDVYNALLKAARVLRRKGKTVVMQPPRCRKCGFEFDRIKASKCPRCRSEWIDEARFFLQEL